MVIRSAFVPIFEFGLAVAHHRLTEVDVTDVLDLLGVYDRLADRKFVLYALRGVLNRLLDLLVPLTGFLGFKCGV